MISRFCTVRFVVLLFTRGADSFRPRDKAYGGSWPGGPAVVVEKHAVKVVAAGDVSFEMARASE